MLSADIDRALTRSRIPSGEHAKYRALAEVDAPLFERLVAQMTDTSLQTKDVDARRTCDLHVRSFDEKARTVECIASTPAIDSYGERVEQKWILDRFERNPVVLFAHQSRTLPIGRAENVRVEDGKLQARIRFVSVAANPDVDKVLASIKEGALRGVSVGFYPHSIRTERVDGQDVVVLSDNELFELSVTSLPANPEALLRSRSAGNATLPRSVNDVADIEAQLTRASCTSEENAIHDEIEADLARPLQRMTGPGRASSETPAETDVSDIEAQLTRAARGENA